MANEYCLVLSDELQAEYYKFERGETCDTEMVKRLLHYYKAPFLTNIAQIERTGVKIGKTLEVALRKAGFKQQSLEDLAKKTVYKVILTTGSDQFPYINIYNDKIENNFCGCFFRNESRSKAIDHIKALCEDALEICIYDKYFSQKNGMQNLRLLSSLLPNKKLEIVCDSRHIEADDIVWLQRYCSYWVFNKQRLDSYHDRYLVIDKRTEVILTSGFDHLGSTTNEFSYIVRPVSQQRFAI
ncbi:hypothetical protein [Bacteroides sp. 519]|uniref:hypothetical protein n=1 Tax=Bacteroides sp. 519 TaxID=2302937 RepID=UPI0013D88E33|nr:hypothetical protein [Bacteroides sp. 519]NDV60255.1 hypothetical protein [Bacteroides sp. 519]